MASFQEILDVPLHTRSTEEQNTIIRRGKPSKVRSLEFVVGEQQRRFLLLKLAQYDWLVLHSAKLFCWPCVLMLSDVKSYATWNHDGLPVDKLTSDIIHAHYDCDSHQQAAKWLEKKRKKLAAISSSASSKVYNAFHGDDRQIVETHLHHLTRYIKPRLIYMSNPKVGLYYFYQSWLKAYPQFKHQYANRVGVLANRLKLNQILNQSISDVMHDEIRTELAMTCYVSIMLEDMCHQDMYSVAVFFRSLHPAKGGHLCDRYLGMLSRTGTDRRKASTIMEQLRWIVREFDLTDKLVAVTFAGIGINNQELDKLIVMLRETYPRVIFTDSTKISQQLFYRLFNQGKTTDMYSTEFYLFIFCKFLLGLEAKITQKSKFVAGKIKVANEKIKSMSLSGLCTLLHTHRIRIIKLFQQWFKESNNDDDIEYWHFLGDFISCLFLPFFAFVLKRIETTEERIRKLFHNWPACDQLINQLEADLWKFKKENYEELYRDAVRRAPEVRTAVTNPQMPWYKISWTTVNLHLKSGTEKKRWFELLDLAIDSTMKLVKKFRFDAWKKLRFFNLVNTSQFARYTKEFPNECLKSLEVAFPRKFRLNKLKGELSYLYAETEVRFPTVEQFLQYFTADQLMSSFPETTKLAKMVHTIPCRIFPAVSAPRVSSRLNVQEEFQELNSLGSDSFYRCEWPLFRELKDRSTSRFYRTVVEHFFQLVELDQKDYSEKGFWDYCPDTDEHDHEIPLINSDNNDEDGDYFNYVDRCAIYSWASSNPKEKFSTKNSCKPYNADDFLGLFENCY